LKKVPEHDKMNKKGNSKKRLGTDTARRGVPRLKRRENRGSKVYKALDCAGRLQGRDLFQEWKQKKRGTTGKTPIKKIPTSTPLKTPH